MNLRGIQLQGVVEFEYWITSFVFLYGDDGSNWTAYIHNSSFNSGINDSTQFDSDFLTNCNNFSYFADCSSLLDACSNACSFPQYELNQTASYQTIYLNGNNNSETVSHTEFLPIILARYIRILPVSWHGGIALRMEMTGCKNSKYKGTLFKLIKFI